MMTTFRIGFSGMLLGLMSLAVNGQQLLPNPGFSEGDDIPDGWTLQGSGQWLDRDVLQVTGDGQDSSAWHCSMDLEPGALYRFQCVAQREGGGGGCMITGPQFANRDQRPSVVWQPFGHVFQVPSRSGKTTVRMGQWHMSGVVQFQSAALRPVLPVHTRMAGLILGEGESIRKGVYCFQTRFTHEGSNYHRTLHRATAGFNSNRWSFGRNQEIVYRFALPQHAFQSGDVRFGVCYHQAGRILLEVSRNGVDWQLLAERAEPGTTEVTVPDALLPAKQTFVRFRTPDEPCAVQVDYVEFTAQVDDTKLDAMGRTVFAEMVEPSSWLLVEEMTCQSPEGATPKGLHISARHTGDGDLAATVQVVVKGADGSLDSLPPVRVQLSGGQSEDVCVPLLPLPAGENRLEVTFASSELPSLVLRTIVEVPDYYRADYGAVVDDAGPATVWWCRGDHKVPRQRALPQRRAVAAELSAARNDYEAVQLVVRAGEKPLVGLTAAAGPLAGPDGAVIKAANIELSQVYYHFVETPTDRTGVRDWWPDALPPLDKPVDVPAGQNQPIWVLVYVPEGATAGEYTGAVTLKAEGFAAEVPVRLYVWDFALPKENHLETAFGLSLGTIARYHRLKTERDRRQVWEKYLALMSRSRLSPYDPVPMDPIRVHLEPDADPPHAELDFEAFDREFARVTEKHHFTNHRLPVRGMGGGTFHNRTDPSIGSYPAGSPQYEATFASYAGQLQKHLEQKGWLDMMYVYWFDEPDPKDYEFVANGMKRLERYAPRLARMLTEQPEDNVLAGTVNIWCPVSHNYDADEAEKCRARGERFWWYVCCGPKTPYCTLFIDHPATELRVWHWQTWQRDIVGTLVWQANYWTSSAAYPDRCQNPYEDPMGWVSGYSTPKGTKRPWGNGDGRFLYPPLTAATPEIAGEGPVLDPPVSSIRLEMLREGVEDYEMLYLLRSLLQQHGQSLETELRIRCEALVEVPPGITADMTTFTTDPEPVYSRRTEIAEAIEQLLRTVGRENTN